MFPFSIPPMIQYWVLFLHLGTLPWKVTAIGLGHHCRGQTGRVAAISVNTAYMCHVTFQLIINGVWDVVPSEYITQ